MDMGIVNPASLGVYDEIESSLRERIEDLLLDRRPDATERLLDAAAGLGGRSGRDEAAEPEWRSRSPSERLVHALVNGVSEWAAPDADEARLALGGALEVISGPLMAGMNKVGDLFGAGKMFLPQVVKSARVMKAAVAVLLPYLKDGKGEIATRGKIVIATVKGDVHDIGKNIVSVVLECNGYEMVDLGVMTPLELSSIGRAPRRFRRRPLGTDHAFARGDGESRPGDGEARHARPPAHRRRGHEPHAYGAEDLARLLAPRRQRPRRFYRAGSLSSSCDPESREDYAIELACRTKG